MKSPAAIIFDMDGVLIDSEPLHNLAWEKLFADLGLAGRHGMDYRHYIGVSDTVFLRDFLQKHHLAYVPAELHARKQHHLLNLVREHRGQFPELRDLIPALTQRYRLAVASSSRQQVIDVVLEVTGLRAYFPITVGGDAVHHHKPDPAVYNLALSKLALPGSECVAIEDSPTGIAAAKAAGLQVIGLVTSLPAARLTGADHVAANFAEIRRLLL